MSKKEFNSLVEEQIKKNAEDDFIKGSDSEILYKAASHLSLAKGAKRARPTLAYLFARSFNLSNKQLVDIAVAAEFIHTASLLHDDVIDEGFTRRGNPTVNALYDNRIAILAGDFLLTQGLRLLQGLPPETSSTALLVIKEMTIASILEVESRKKEKIDYAYWRKIAEGKTGFLFGWCGQAPAILAGDTKAAEAYFNCGRHLGVAFQIADDIRDFYGQDSGKKKFIDILNHNPNMLLIKAAENSKEWDERLQEFWQKTLPSLKDEKAKELAAEQIGKELLKINIVEESSSLLEIEVVQALDYLKEFELRDGVEDLQKWIEALYKGYASGTKLSIKNLWNKVKWKTIEKTGKI